MVPAQMATFRRGLGVSWLVLLALGLLLGGCGEEEAFAPSRATVKGYTVVHLGGTPYEMGYQHGQLLEAELKEGVKAIEEDISLKAMFVMARAGGYVELAKKNSFPDLLEECRGMVDAVGATVGWTMEHCLVLNFGDVVAEFIAHGKPEVQDITPGCSQVVAEPSVTSDGKLYHARILDWTRVDFIVKYPVIFVRRPTGGVAHVVVGFPGNLSPYQGMNAAGLSIASNEAHPRSYKDHDYTGRSHVQLVGELLGKTRSLAEASAMAKGINHMTMELITVADGAARTGAVIEMAPAAVAVRKPKDGVVYATNHFVGPKTAELDQDPVKENSAVRMERLQQLLAPAKATGSLLGQLSPANLVTLMRDRKNPRTGKESPRGTVDDEQSLATNGALYQLVFDPAGLRFWVAAGAMPVPEQRFTGFSLGALLGMEGHTAPTDIP